MHAPPASADSQSAVWAFWDKLSRRSQSNLYFALAFLDRERRTAFRDVYRFLRGADDAADTAPTPELASARLRQWREQIDEIYGARARAQHPSAMRLARSVRRYRLSRRHFDAILNAIERDARTPSIATWAELRAYCESIAASLGYLSLELLELDRPDARLYAKDVGIALQLANIVRDVAEDAQRGHTYLPADELRDSGLSPEAVLREEMSPALAAVVSLQAARARRLIADARAQLTPPSRNALLVPEIWADIYLALLDLLEESGYDVFAQAPYLPRRRKVAIALSRWLRTVPRRFAARALPRRTGLW